jgi:hypothetical protein
VQPAGAGKPGFTLMPGTRTGIHFTNQLSMEAAANNQNLLNGAGLAAGDYDGDGLPDLYLCSIEGRNALYRNLGDWRFEDVTESAGVACTNQHNVGAVFADLNGDGRLDLLVTSNGGPNAYFLNEGSGRFRNATAEAGLVLSKLGSTSMAVADIDGDGDLDVYVANYGENTLLRGGGRPSYVTDAQGNPRITGRWARRLRFVDGYLVEFGEVDALFINEGGKKFTRASWTDGRFVDEDGKAFRAAPLDLGLSVMFRDMNGDGFPDLYVCNDFQTPDRAWVNDGRGRFRPLPRGAMRQMSNFSMGVDFADLDRDGDTDVFVADMLSRAHALRMTQMGVTNPPSRVAGQFDDCPQIRRNTLFINRGDGTYAELANYAGLEASDWTWCPMFLDVDLDGYEDLLISNGHAFDTQDWDTIERLSLSGERAGENRVERMLWFPRLDTANYGFRNQGDLTFKETGEAWGFASKQVTHGLVTADFDTDGDLDVAASCLNAQPLIYRNESIAPRVLVRLRGDEPNTQGVGARIRVLGGAVERQEQEVIAGGRYLSGGDAARVFAAGGATNLLTIEVRWRSGHVTTITQAKANSIYEIAEPVATNSAPAASTNATGAGGVRWFRDVSSALNHRHAEQAFDDFSGQRLLPRRLSQLGPGVAWVDLDGDGAEELAIGSGAGGALAVYRNRGAGQFERWSSGVELAPTPRDHTGFAVWTSAPSAVGFVLGSANWEDGRANGAAVTAYQGNADGLTAKPMLEADGSSVGPLAVGDIDGDGDLDLFVGGRVVPRRYPQPASSRMFRNAGGVLQLDEAQRARMRELGLVSGAVFSDLTGDGLPELVVACEWGAVRVFGNARGQLTEITQQAGLDQHRGWWTGVNTGDIDGDGRLDIIAGNWGLNSAYACGPRRPLRMYYGDLAQAGVIDIVEAYTDPSSGSLVPRRDLRVLGAVLPFLRGQFPTHRAFGQATIEQVLGERRSYTAQVEVNTLASMVFFNRGDRFDAVPLPAAAQFAPVFATCVADADGDGREDIFLSQNFFANEAEMPRLDAGQGLWLRGVAGGRLEVVSGADSGVVVNGEQRGAAVADMDRDGRVDLVVTQNGAGTRLYRNERAQAGLRVRLSGPPWNPRGVGVQLRLGDGRTWGPVRELHGGSGYWSQDSLAPVLATGGKATHVWARWPGGKVVTAPLPASAREIVFKDSGEVELVQVP